jgi:maltose alpha-D-glucosyltransferase/alpha-amylase
MRQIGRRTAELHQALGSRSDIPDFAPEPISADDVARWTNTLVAGAEAKFDLLDNKLSTLPEMAVLIARQLLDNRSAILAHIETGRATAFDGIKIRHHGDFHLGQVLIAKDDAHILDFEGEPRRSLEERRAKAPPARDVAGFIRSIDYAISAAIDRTADLSPEDRSILTPLMQEWGERLTAEYWDSYRATPAEVLLWPVREDHTRQLLDLFLLEKAFYEIEYELANRPAWSHIPLEATLRILQQRGVISS